MKNLPLVIVLPFFAYGCQSVYSVQYDSTPQSAMVVCGHEQKGFTPLTLSYVKAEETQYLNTIPCKAHWISGAQADFPDRFDTVRFPQGIRTVVESPNIDGRDIQFDYKRKQEQARLSVQQQAIYEQAVQNQAWRNTVNQAVQSINKTLTNNSLRNNRPKTTYCNRIGRQTVCRTY